MSWFSHINWGKFLSAVLGAAVAGASASMASGHFTPSTLGVTAGVGALAAAVNFIKDPTLAPSRDELLAAASTAAQQAVNLEINRVAPPLLQTPARHVADSAINAVASQIAAAPLVAPATPTEPITRATLQKHIATLQSIADKLPDVPDTSTMNPNIGGF